MVDADALRGLAAGMEPTHTSEMTVVFLVPKLKLLANPSRASLHMTTGTP